MTGDELREARLGAGLAQCSVAAAAGISISEVSRIERGAAPRVPFERLAVVAAILGLDLPLRVFPGGDPIRDQAQVALLARSRALLPPGLSWRTEVPIRQAGDRRAWDAVVGGPGWRLPLDAETRINDVQALARREALKRRDDGATSSLLLVAGTRHNRQVLRLTRADLIGAFPTSGARALASLAKGVPPESSAIVLL